MRRCAVSDGFRVPFIGKIVNSPNRNRISRDCKGTLRLVDDVNTVAKWISSRGWNVIFERKGETGVVPALRNVTIDSTLTKSAMLHSILHEAGHVSLFSQDGYIEKYKDGYIRNATGENTRSLKHKVDVVGEELAAWGEGESIAKMLNVQIDIDRYRLERNKSMKTYLLWAVE